MTNDEILKFLETHEHLVDADDWDAIYALYYKDYDAAAPLTIYLHELGFDPLPYMHSVYNQMYGLCKWLKEITIPNSVTSIGSSAFYYCMGLTNITIPDSVTLIGRYAFAECNNVTSVEIGNGVTNIGAFAFWSCIGLKSVTIGNGVTNIGYSAFEYCSKLTSITYKGTKVQWGAIKKSADWKSSVPAEVVHCKDGKVKI